MHVSILYIRIEVNILMFKASESVSGTVNSKVHLVILIITAPVNEDCLHYEAAKKM